MLQSLLQELMNRDWMCCQWAATSATKTAPCCPCASPCLGSYGLKFAISCESHLGALGELDGAHIAVDVSKVVVPL